MSHTIPPPALTPTEVLSAAPGGFLPEVDRAEFATTPATVADLARRVGLALAVLTSVGDVALARDRAVQVLLTGSTDDAVTLV